MSVNLDAVTGLPLDDSYLTQYQIPLGSQPINLEELGALGRQSNWLYPDNLPGVVSRLQARDNTNPLNAQDLSTDGKRNLNVNIAGSGTVENANATMLPNNTWSVEYGMSSGGSVVELLLNPVDILYQLTWSIMMNGSAAPIPGPSSRLIVGIGDLSTRMRLLGISLPQALTPTDRFACQSDTIVWSGGMDLRHLTYAGERTHLIGVMELQPSVLFLTLQYWSASGGQ